MGVAVDMIRCAIDSKQKQQKKNKRNHQLVKYLKKRCCESLPDRPGGRRTHAAESIIWGQISRSGPDSLCTT